MDHETGSYIIFSVLMGKYHQSYSEIRKMPTSLVRYLMHLAEAEARKQKKQIDKLNSKIKK